MTYQSVDALQKALANTVFDYAKDRKKAAGRALGTVVELITFYTLCAWGLRDQIAIERRVPEFANPDITHNVEFSLHAIRARDNLTLVDVSVPITTKKLSRHSELLSSVSRHKNNTLISTQRVLRNSCLLADPDEGPLIANLDRVDGDDHLVSICHLYPHPFAVFECKRVGVEDGQKKGPQTIEKAKQGAYVARTVSSLQRMRLRDGTSQGVLEKPDGSIYIEPYEELLSAIVDGDDADMLDRFVLTVGVVSNHGNWFTSDNPNKELRVLAGSYDWLLFLTDDGIAQFIEQLLLDPSDELAPAREAFERSYSGTPGKNVFTKVKIDLDADQALKSYFCKHEDMIKHWYNLIAPAEGSLEDLHAILHKLASKNWGGIYSR